MEDATGGPELRRFTLDNGLRVSIDPWRPGVSSFAALTLFGGARAEAHPGEAQVAKAVLEPQFTHGTPFDFGVGLYHDLMSDRETWLVRTPTGNLENGIEILAAIGTSLRIDEESWTHYHRQLPELERSLALPASRAYLAQARDLGLEDLDALSVENLEAVTETDVRARVDRMYRPENATLVIVGPTDVSAAERFVRTWASSWRAATGTVSPSRSIPNPPVGSGPRYVLTDQPAATQVTISAICPMPAGDDAELLASVVADLARGDLRRRLRSHLGVTYGVKEGVRPGVGRDVLVLETSVATAQIKASLAAIAEELARWQSRRFGRFELERALFGVLRDRAWARESGFTRTRAIATGAAGSAPQAISEEAVAQAFADCYRDLVIALIGPIEPLRLTVPASWEKSVLSE